MTRFGIDPGGLLAIAEQRVVVAPGHSLVAPNRVMSDVLAGLLADVRGLVRTEKDALELHTRATETKVRLLGDRVSRRTAWKLARDHDWPDLRDAEYLAVTKLQADALVTSDPHLASLAQRIVPVVGLDALSRATAPGTIAT